VGFLDRGVRDGASSARVKIEGEVRTPPSCIMFCCGGGGRNRRGESQKSGFARIRAETNEI